MQLKKVNIRSLGNEQIINIENISFSHDVGELKGNNFLRFIPRRLLRLREITDNISSARQTLDINSSREPSKESDSHYGMELLSSS